MAVPEEKFELYAAERRKGKTIAKHHYYKVANFIVSAISDKLDNVITLNQLLDDAQLNFSATLGFSTSWYVLLIKQDLEVRSILKTSFGRNRIQYIHINKRKLRAENKTIHHLLNPVLFEN